MEDLHKAFCTTISLTRLATAINNHGQPILASPTTAYNPSYKTKDGHNLVSNWIAALTVCKYEVVIVMALPTLTTCEPTSWEPKSNDEGESIQWVRESEGLIHIAAVANLNRDNCYIDNDSLLMCTLVRHGTSHMAGIWTPNCWENCFQILWAFLSFFVLFFFWGGYVIHLFTVQQWQWSTCQSSRYHGRFY